jgi:LPXTG-motif cell wall-anchored protein
VTAALLLPAGGVAVAQEDDVSIGGLLLVAGAGVFLVARRRRS